MSTPVSTPTRVPSLNVGSSSVGTASPQAQQATTPGGSVSVINTPLSAAQREEDAAMMLKEDRLTAEQRAKRDEVRAQVIAEIQSTEASYVQALDALSQCFVRPLKERLASNKHFQDISPVLGEHLCSNLETLTGFHHSFRDALALVKAEDATHTNAATPADTDADAPPSIPSVFLRFSHFFKLYIPYLNGYTESLNTFNSLRSHKKFQEWLQGDVKLGLRAHALKNGVSDIDLLSYMIQPVQRVPRYVLLLKELKRQTSPYHPEFASLNDALLKVQHVASVINEGQRAVENANKLMTIQNRIVDMLVWTGETYKFKGTLDLTPAKLTPKSSTSFVIDTANKMIQATCESEEETKAWFEAIDEVVCSLQNQRELLRQRARVQRARNLGTTAEKDAVHKLVTQSLQGLAVSNETESATLDGATGTDSAPGSMRRSISAPGGTIGRGSMGQRVGRKWQETLEAGEEKLRREQEHLAAFSRAQLADDTFSAPDAANATDAASAPPVVDTTEASPPPPEYDSFASSSASPPAVSSTSGGGVGSTPVVGGDKKYVARFVSRRGRGTLGRALDGCLCTTILVHKDCPTHGEHAQELLAPDE